MMLPADKEPPKLFSRAHLRALYHRGKEITGENGENLAAAIRDFNDQAESESEWEKKAKTRLERARERAEARDQRPKGILAILEGILVR
jgi:hypothetical protein